MQFVLLKIGHRSGYTKSDIKLIEKAAKENDIEMNDPDATIFKYIQQLIKPFPSSQRSERIKRIFEPTYT